MLRIMGFVVALLLMASTAYAEVWMVRPSGAIGCRDRELLKVVESTGSTPPAGCVRLYAGERLLEPSNSGGGFTDYIAVHRADGSLIFVLSSLLAADPGIGSVEDDRPER